MITLIVKSTAMIIDIRKNIYKIRESGTYFTDGMDKQLRRVAAYLKLEDAISQQLTKKKTLGLTD